MKLVSARTGLLCMLAGLLGSPCIDMACAGELVQWVDEQGGIHFSDSLENVPAKYRGKAKLDKLQDAPIPPTPQSKDLSLQRVNEPVPVKPQLKSHEVPFTAYDGRAQRVIVSVRFNDSVTAPIAIDTGAPGLLISPKLANQLGLLSGDEGRVLVQTGGIGGRVPAVKTFMDKVQVGEATDTFIPTTVVASISGAFEGLLGMDFMSKYTFKIDSVKQVVMFEEVEPNPSWPGGRPERWWRDRYRELHDIRAAWKRFVPQGYWQGQYPTEIGRLAAQQVNEVDKLMNKLDRHASQHAVPQHWR